MLGIVIESATAHSDGEIVIVGVLTVESLGAREKLQNISTRVARYCANTGARIEVSSLGHHPCGDLAVKFHILPRPGVSLALTSAERPGLQEKVEAAGALLSQPRLRVRDYTRAGDVLFFGLTKIIRTVARRHELAQACERITKLCS